VDSLDNVSYLQDGLYFYCARYCDPSTGRWLSEDPLRFQSGDSNFYRYVLNNPIGFRDPAGMSCQCRYTISTGHSVCYGSSPKSVGPIIVNGFGYSGQPQYKNDPFYDNVPGGPYR
jgi:RHS repeat-associated protein